MAKNIFIFSWGYPSNQTKGNPFVEDAVHMAHENGVTTTVIIFQFKNILEFFFPYKKHLTYTSKRGENIVSIPLYNIPFVSTLIRKKIMFWQVVFRMKSLMKKIGKPDLLQQHYIFHSMPYITNLIATKFKIPYVLFEHSPVYSPQHFKTKYKTFCQPYFSKEDFQAFIKNAHGRFAYKVQIETLSGYYGQSFKPFDGFLPNYLLQNESNGEESTDQKPFNFLCIGTLDDRKGTLRLIEAFSKIPQRQKCHLTFCGSGPYLNKAKELIEKFELKSNVTITGFIPRSSVIEQLKKSDFLVIASSYETFGMTCIEAMAYGIPVLSTKCGGPETIINPSVGILCEKDDINSLSQALQQAFDQKENFSPQTIQQHFKTYYSEESAWRNMREIYDSIS